MADNKISRRLFNEAQKVIPGGVNSPVRAWKSVGLEPLFINRARGARIWDADGNEYIDYVGSWGPMILGHAPARVIAAIKRTATGGTSFGAPTEAEVDLAGLIVKLVPSVEKVRLVSSGTEATMSALRLARAFTGRKKLIKFDGCYHGHADSFLVAAGSGVATFGIPGSPGVPEDLVQHTVVLPYNDLAAVEEAFQNIGPEVAAIIVEPVAGNMGVVPPAENFLAGLRDLCTRNGALLIFDEVITGFRVALGGAQQLYNIRPDLTCLGKIIGGGLPVGAFGGRADIMDRLAPVGDVYQAGTLSGNPLAVAAGLETLRILSEGGVYAKLERRAAMLEAGLAEALKAQNIPACLTRVGSLSCLFFTGEPVVDFGSAKTCDTERFSRYFAGMLKEGIYLAPSQFEAAFISTTHTLADIERTLEAATKVIKRLG
ncbi:MAG: glutamate-1-semialdehyde 2,1-aminomutase [Pseudomonadota bacterium]